MATDPDLARLVEAYRQALGDDLIAVVLFGSRARGEARKDSDWDIFILAGGLPDNPFDRQMFLRDVLFANRIFGVSVVAKTREEFEDNLLSLYLDIAADGVILFDREGYMARKLDEVRRITQKARLRRVRKRGLRLWEWEQPPRPGKWAIRWSDQ